MPPIHRIEVHPNADERDPRGESIRRAARGHLHCESLADVRTANVYLIEADLRRDQLDEVVRTLLSDAVTQTPVVGVRPPPPNAQLVEVHPLPGVMDPAAQSVESSIRELLGVEARVRTGVRYDLLGVEAEEADRIARRLLANTTIHAVHRRPHAPQAFPVGHPQPFRIREVPLRDLDDTALQRLSREAHLFLSLDEMKAIQAEYRALGREPRDVELETLAQTWSEHCVHKTLKSTIVYRDAMWDRKPGAIPGPSTAADGLSRESLASRPNHIANSDGSVTIKNLLKSTVAAATHELIADGVDWTLSVFVDNSGVIAFDDEYGVCFKVETHNHPSAIEPYGGAATGIGGCIRDVIGTGLGAKPIASTDVFCVALPDVQSVPAGCLHPRRILSQVVAGVRDYGNRMGIPTVNGTVWFDERYVGNPLVYCGCIGLIPRGLVRGQAKAGDRIVALGGRTGRDGIHGATFSSAELTDTHADEFGHAVQIGNAITEKRMLDAILQARDYEAGCLYHAITDCGAGGFSSAVGEMGSKLGAEVHLDRAPLKYEGLTYTEIWISEAQERMVLAAPPENVERLRAICEVEGVEMCDLGHFGTPGADLILHYQGIEVGRLPMGFLHEGIPMPTREAVWTGRRSTGLQARAKDPLPRSHGGQEGIEEGGRGANPVAAIGDQLLALLADPIIASKHWIVRQYDHEVQGATVVKPLVGVRHNGPSDAAVILPRLESARGLAVANGLAVGWAEDPYLMALAAIDECVRNLVCVGADPSRIAILDNFCWPSCQKPENLGALVRAAEGCYDAAKAYRTPFISGKDSLNNQFTTEKGETIEIPPTLLISGFGIVPDAARCVTMDAKRAENLLVVVGATAAAMGGSRFAAACSFAAGDAPNLALPAIDLAAGPRAARAVARLIAQGLVRAAHDCSEGGLLVAAAEMAFAGGLGLELDLAGLPVRDAADAGNGGGSLNPIAACFAETTGRYLLEVREEDRSRVAKALEREDVPWGVVGRFDEGARLTAKAIGLSAAIADLKAAWLGTLDW